MVRHRHPEDRWRTRRTLRELLTLDELTHRVGMSVRNIRFYTTKGLVPPPIRRGRSGYYTADHVARLELVQELQSHGFTLSAIEKYVARIPADASPGGHRPAPDDARAVDGRARRDELSRARARAAAPGARARPTTTSTPWPRSASSSRPSAGRFQVAIVAARRSASALLDLGFPIEAALRRRRHVRRARPRDRRGALRAVPHQGVAGLQGAGRLARSGSGRSSSGSSRSRSPALVQAYEAGMDETERANIAKRAR